MDAKDRNSSIASDLDEVTEQLRAEFALLNKIIELRELGSGHLNQKQSRKASKAAAKAAIKANKQTGKGQWSLKAPTPKQPAGPSKWIEKVCWRCKSKFKIHADWERPPTLCKVCAKDLDQTYLPSGPDHSTPFASVHFVRGGAPSLGKRR
ncbi:MAG: hypothetical protein LBE53_19275 [Paucimonas sp.]|jgi:hypothetical protein|nr:hypothetical protein [Paucimonas sp.]